MNTATAPPPASATGHAKDRARYAGPRASIRRTAASVAGLFSWPSRSRPTISLGTRPKRSCAVSSAEADSSMFKEESEQEAAAQPIMGVRLKELRARCGLRASPSASSSMRRACCLLGPMMAMLMALGSTLEPPMASSPYPAGS